MLIDKIQKRHLVSHTNAEKSHVCDEMCEDVKIIILSNYSQISLRIRQPYKVIKMIIFQICSEALIYSKY